MSRETVKLGDVCLIGDGNHSSNYPKVTDMVERGVPFIRAGNIQNGRISRENLRFLSNEKHQILKKGHLKNGDVLLTNRGELGKSAIVTEEFNNANLNSQVAWLRPNESILSKYLYYCLNTKKIINSINSVKTGTALQQLTIKQIKEIKVHLPPLQQQQQIVERLDTAFEEIDEITLAHSNAIEMLIGLENSYCNEILKSYENELKIVQLHELTSKITDGVHKKPNYVENGIPFLKINNLTENEGISFAKTSFITEDDHKEFIKRTRPEKDDILITKDGTIGIVRRIETEIEFSIFVSLALIKPKRKELSNYLTNILQSSFCQKQLNPSGAALKHIYLKDLRKLKIPIANDGTNQKITSKLNLVRENTTNAGNFYTRAVAQLDNLKSAILTQALTPS